MNTQTPSVLAVIIFVSILGGGCREESAAQQKVETPSADASELSQRQKKIERYESEPKGIAAPAESKSVLRVAVFDDTKSQKLPRKAEVWIRGLGSWWIQPECEDGGTLRIVDLQRNSDQLSIFPDSREAGIEIKVPYEGVTDNPSNVRDMLRIEIGDDEVKVFGTPLKAATGSLELRFDRRNAERIPKLETKTPTP